MFSSIVAALLKAIGISTNSNLQSTGSSIIQPVATLIANPNQIVAGGSTQLLWTSSGTQSCTVYNGAGIPIASGGSDGSVTQQEITMATVFTIRCVTSAGQLISGQTSVLVQ